MQHGPNTNTQSQNNTFFKQMMLYALYPIAKALAVPPTQPFAKIAAEQQKKCDQQDRAFKFLANSEQHLCEARHDWLLGCDFSWYGKRGL